MPEPDGTTDRTDAPGDGVDSLPEAILPRHAHRRAPAEPEPDAVEPPDRADAVGTPDEPEPIGDEARAEEDAAAEDAVDDDRDDTRGDDRDDDRDDTRDDEEPAEAAPAQRFVPAGAGSRFTPAAPSGTRRLWNAVTQKPDGGQLLVAVLVFMLGFGAVLQVRADDEDTLANARRDDLVQILDGLRRQGDRLDDHVGELEADRRDLISGADTEQAALEQAQERARTTGVLAGTIPATGPGIIMTISDPGHRVNAILMLRAINELRVAGAEAIQIRGHGNDSEVRVVADTSFVNPDLDVLAVGGQIIEPPYEVVAIGEPSELSGSMTFPDGVVDRIQEQEDAEATVDEYDELTVDVLHEPKAPQYARPAPEDEDE
ncbi:DUF881 domain-containing protein [Jiangella mangrovi]|uniref:Uncharacterized protein YlxW (UPF0749 family) n=1 Tax=Jiangella mangrovi TaxID=1524084 RepID=A0A7W9GT05_9ACTN|nr:DUF881 domain-containing protein [Jiangella mangrovi]MBB5789510.1 uncharacterized protein YlxW (UPF0749 family) [Jiangella mangrovi]